MLVFIFNVLFLGLFLWSILKKPAKRDKDYASIVAHYGDLFVHAERQLKEQRKTIESLNATIENQTDALESTYEVLMQMDKLFGGEEIELEEGGEEEAPDNNEQEKPESPTRCTNRKLFQKLVDTREMVKTTLGEDHPLVKQITERIDAH